jgi:hypothetical protein
MQHHLNRHLLDVFITVKPKRANPDQSCKKVSALQYSLFSVHDPDEEKKTFCREDHDLFLVITLKGKILRELKRISIVYVTLG